MKRTQAILITGMHRSGTSAITRSVNFLGPYIGQDTNFVTPLDDNPTGYWERNDILELNELIFENYRKTWDCATPFPENWHRSQEIEPIKSKLISIFKKQFLDHEIWAVKDPRISILLPLWKDVLNEMGVKFSVIIALRNPIDVSASLEKRNGFPINKTFGIWFNYNIHAIKLCRGIPYTLVHYDKLIDSWESTIKTMAFDVGLPWPADTESVKKNMDSFIHPDLRHSNSGVGRLMEINAPKPVIELYEILLGMSEDSANGKEYDHAIDRLFEDFSSFAKFYQYDSAVLWENTKNLLYAGKMIGDIKNSMSWKISSPLRGIEKLLFDKKQEN